MRTSQYIQAERRIMAADGGGIRQRWHYGGRLINDPQAASGSGKSLRHGVLERLIEAARKAGYALSETEIRYRIRAAKTYRTEAQIIRVIDDFGTWTALCAAKFPPVADDPDEPTEDHLTDQERREALFKAIVEEFGEQGVLFHVADLDPDSSTVKDLIAYDEQQQAFTKAIVAEDAKRHAYVEKLRNTPGVTEETSWRDAHRAAYGSECIGGDEGDQGDDETTDG